MSVTIRPPSRPYAFPPTPTTEALFAKRINVHYRMMTWITSVVIYYASTPRGPGKYAG
jgi:hypothetical protein